MLFPNWRMIPGQTQSSHIKHKICVTTIVRSQCYAYEKKKCRHFFRMFLDHSPLRSLDLCCGQNALNKNYVWHYGHWAMEMFFFSFMVYYNTLTLGWCIAWILSLSRKLLFFFACSLISLWVFVKQKNFFFGCDGNLELWILLHALYIFLFNFGRCDSTFVLNCEIFFRLFCSTLKLDSAPGNALTFHLV